MFKKCLGGVMLALLLGLPGKALAAPVGLELLLLVDISGSVDANEYNLQKNGYVNAFKSLDIQNAIAGITNGIAVSYVEWSGANQFYQLVDWTHLTDAASSDAFGDSIAGTTRAGGGSYNLTAPGSAINNGVPLFNNAFDGSRLVIDVSGDGSQNDGANTAAAAAAAKLAGITVNGLAILGSEFNLDVWYTNNISGPGGGFTLPAAGFITFEDAVKTKIGREITGVPEPASFALFALGVAGLAARRRRAVK